MRKIFLPAILASLWVSCQPNRVVQESPIPSSLSMQSLKAPDTVDLSAFFLKWYPRDWRVHLVSALVSQGSAEKWEAYMEALRLNPDEPLVLYFAALNRLEGKTPSNDSLALTLCEHALSFDPDNGVLELTHAVALARLGFVHQARAIFRTTRGFPRSDLFGERLEQVLVALLDQGLRLNPYDLISAHDWYLGIPLPPLEEWAEGLEIIFLDPLLEHPYDIRKRGLEAAEGLFRLGGEMVRGSLNPDRIFSDGREERLLGRMLQVKAADFLDRYATAFGDFPGQGGFAPESSTRLFLPALDQSSRPAPRWDRFLSAWEVLGMGGRTVGQAGEAMRRDPTWKLVLRKTSCRSGAGC